MKQTSRITRLNLVRLEDKVVPQATIGAFDGFYATGPGINNSPQDIDSGNSVVASGWSFDQDFNKTSNSVHLYYGGNPADFSTYIYGDPGDPAVSGTTTVVRNDVNAVYQIPPPSQPHGFNISIPTQYRDGGSYYFRAYGIDLNPGVNTFLGTLLYKNNAPYGYLDVITPGGKLKGWALDPDSPWAKAQVDIFINGSTTPITIKTDTYRSDINGGVGYHGFEYQLPAQYLTTQVTSISLKVRDTQLKGATTSLYVPLSDATNVEFQYVPPVTIQSPQSVSNGGPIRVSTQSNTAGAISSITWNGLEFVDKADHGRLAQSALWTDPERFGANFNIQRYNPTEAGSFYDSRPFPNSLDPTRPSSSRVTNISASGTQFSIGTQMAFWSKPGGYSAPLEAPAAANETVLSDYTVQKTVTVGASGLPSNVISVTNAFTIPAGDKVSHAQIFPMITYTTSSLTYLERYNRSTQQAERIASYDHLSNFTKIEGDPVMASQSSSPTAPSIGQFTVALTPSNGWTYTRDYQATSGIGSPSEAKYGWLVEAQHIRRTNLSQPHVSGTFTFQTYIVVGNRQDVKNTLAQLASSTSTAGDLTPSVSGLQYTSSPVPNEQPTNAKDNNIATKWLANGSLPNVSATILYEFLAPQQAMSYSITSAPDSPSRDPKDWILDGIRDNGTIVQLDSRTGQSFANRGTTNAYHINTQVFSTTPESFRYYRLTITANNGSRETNFGGTGLIQLAEFRLSK